MFSVLILTLNEELDLPRCLESVRASDDIVVFDSFSTDQTVEVAHVYGARVVQRKFDNYAAQRNAALAVGFKHPWVLMVDADERVTEELWLEIETVLAKAPASVALFRMRRKDMFFGRWLRRSSGYPTWFSRLVRVGRVVVEREINEEVRCEGHTKNLHGHLLHNPFSKGIAFWFERHNRYSTMEARRLVVEVRQPMVWLGLLSRDPVVRRRCFKQLAYRLPGRPILAFLYLYVWRGGFLDGRPGFRFCRMRAIYEYMIDVKVAELLASECAVDHPGEGGV